MVTAALQSSLADFDKWKAVFDANEGFRRGHGATGHRVLRKGNDILILLDFPDESTAQAFLSNPTLRENMKEAGVQGASDVRVWDESDEVRY